MTSPSVPNEDLESLAVLGDELRRNIYFFIRSSRDPVTRQDVADEVGISVKLAAFHLDKLIDHGLLRAHYARPPGRGGPGAGRSAKYYEPSDVEIEVSVPERNYDLLGELLVKAVRTHSKNESATDAAVRVAHQRGEALGDEVRRKLRAGAITPARAMTMAEKVLTEQGYEPYRRNPGEIRMRNCPFHRLAQQDVELVCGMNHAFIGGFMDRLGIDAIEVALEPTPDECCVTLRQTKTARPAKKLR